MNPVQPMRKPAGSQWKNRTMQHWMFRIDQLLHPDQIQRCTSFDNESVVYTYQVTLALVDEIRHRMHIFQRSYPQSLTNEKMQVDDLYRFLRNGDGQQLDFVVNFGFDLTATEEETEHIEWVHRISSLGLLSALFNSIRALKDMHFRLNKSGVPVCNYHHM